MSDTVIRVENLSKKYVLSHQKETGAYRYKSLRDTLTNSTKGLFNRFGNSGKTLDSSREEFWALRDVSFEIKQGDRVGIIGRNGAGKSTLLKVLSRIVEPTSGSIRIKGRVASLLEVGTGFHPELTGRENIFLNGAILGMSKAEIQRKFDEIVDFAEVEKFLDTPVKRYSSGMYVRLAFSVAAHLEPEILIVDEVLAVGDAAFQKKCLGRMGEVAEEGRTILFVSHNMLAIKRLCNQSVYLKRGRVVEQGTTSEIIDNYLNEFSTEVYRVQDGISQKSPHFVYASLEDDIGNPIQSINSSEQAHIRVEWTVPESLPQLRIGLGINSSDGIRIFGSLPEENNICISSKSGKYSAKISIPENCFLEGTYSVALCLWSENQLYDYPDPAFSFQVHATLSPAYAKDNRREGLIQIPCSWKVDLKDSEVFSLNSTIT